jgi:hypothetical protein
MEFIFMPVKKITKKPAAKKPAAKPARAVKAPAKMASEKKTKPAKSEPMVTRPEILIARKAKEKGESIESLITERQIELKPVEEFLGLKVKQDYRNKPIIPDVFDLLIPPGTPRKLILKLAKEHPVQIVRRDDIYVPVGICDVERDLLAIRGDKKTIQKMEKILLEEIAAFIDGHDAQRHDYSKPVKLDGISVPEKKVVKAKVKVKAKAKK